MKKIKECGEVVGISVVNSNGGWDKLIAFAHDRERKNRKALAQERSRKKRSRELQSLSCSINYKKKFNSKMKKSDAKEVAPKPS